MTTWKNFYSQIRDPSWPDCDQEEDFLSLPEPIQHECQTVFGYVPGAFAKTSKLEQKVFPIQTATACQLKWTWSTIFLTKGKTASCHRTNHHRFDTEQFDFHNTPQKINDRSRMLQGLWPQNGCDYCKNIELASGTSDRITNLDFPGIHAPVELDTDHAATHVTPRMLEVYFDNTCNLKCLYCGPHFSSAWDAENVRFGLPRFAKDPNLEANKLKLFQWLEKNRQHLTVFNILGGEPLYQPELEQCLDFFEKHPAPELKLQIFTNLNAKLSFVQKIVTRVKQLVECDAIREFEITASLDCWGEPQEYVRYPMDLKVWEENFEYLLSQSWINLIINSTLTPLTIKTFPDLVHKFNQWNQVRPIYHYQNSVNGPSYMFIDIFGDIFQDDFQRAIDIKPQDTPEQQSSRNYLKGIATQSAHPGPNINEIHRLYDFLNTMDQRRQTHWPSVFPWLVDEFSKYGFK